jgi:hypothetical protein
MSLRIGEPPLRFVAETWRYDPLRSSEIAVRLSQITVPLSDFNRKTWLSALLPRPRAFAAL